MTDSTPRSSDAEQEHDRIIEMLSALVEPLGRSMPTSIEVVLHDLARLPDSIVAVHGDVTGRRVGDPATDLLLERAASDTLEQEMVGYLTRLPDGRTMRSTTMVVHSSTGTPVAALCLNADLSMWSTLERVAAAMLGGHPAGAPAAVAPAQDSSAGAGEVFAHDVDELAAHLLHQAIAEQGVPVELMKKEHKLEVVRSLRKRGMFMLRDAVENVAASLRVTRFTIYNYLNELDGSDPTSAPDTRRRKAAAE